MKHIKKVHIKKIESKVLSAENAESKKKVLDSRKSATAVKAACPEIG